MLGRSGVTTSQIVTSLRQSNNVMDTGQDIYNLRREERNRMLADRSALVALLDGLALGESFSQFDVLQRLYHLLIISPSAMKICNNDSAGRVWLIDASYKTSRYGLPPPYYWHHSNK